MTHVAGGDTYQYYPSNQFELNFNNINLIRGYNGSGTSTLFDVIRKLQQFIVNESKVEEVFQNSDFTKKTILLDYLLLDSG